VSGLHVELKQLVMAISVSGRKRMRSMIEVEGGEGQVQKIYLE
jgi:hypothetical protein